jgi:hypothetical protein
MTKNFQNPNSSNQVNQFSGESSPEPEHTLRLVAELPPPSELTDRVHQRLSDARTLHPHRRFWSFWMPAQRLQFVGAALLVVAFAGSTWSVYHAKGGAPTRIPAPQNPPSPASPMTGGFGSAGAERHPSTLTPIKVPPAAKKKPSASHAAIMRTLKPDSTQSEAGQSSAGQSDLKSPTAP